MEQTKQWLKPAITSHGGGCLCCKGTTDTLDLETYLYPMGWKILKDGETFFVEDDDKDFDECRDLIYVESLIPKDDNSEYLAIVYLPLRGATYQRHEPNKWVLIEQNEGFA